MARSDDSDDYDEEEEDFDEDEYEDEAPKSKGKGSKGKRPRSLYIDDAAEEDDDEDEDEEEEEEQRHKKRKRGAAAFIDDAADVADEDEEEEEEDYADDLIDDNDLPNEVGANRQEAFRSYRDMARNLDEDEEDDEAGLEKFLKERYERYDQAQDRDEDEAGPVDSEALAPSVDDPKLWMVKCQFGREKEAAICLMQKSLARLAEGRPLQIRSAAAIDHLKGYLYIEAMKESHVREAITGLRILYYKITLVPIREMRDVLRITKKQLELQRDTWVRVRNGLYKGDLAQVVDVDHVRNQATLKLIPRVDLQELARRLEGEGREQKKKTRPPQRFFSLDEARDLRIPVESKRDNYGDAFEFINNLKFRDGYFFKTVSLKSIEVKEVVPSFDELQRFQNAPQGEDGSTRRNDLPTLTDAAISKKKVHFVPGDSIRVVEGELKSLQGTVVHVDELQGIVRVRLRDEDWAQLGQAAKAMQKEQELKDSQIRKHYSMGDHVKVLSGQHEGSTGLIVKVDDATSTVVLFSDTTQQEIRVFSHDIVEAAEVSSGLTKFGEYDLHDLIALDNGLTVGMIVRVEKDACAVLIGNPDRQDVRTVTRPQIKRKVFDRSFSTQDMTGAAITVRDVVKVHTGEFKGKQGPVVHLSKQMLFIQSRDVKQNGGFICVAARNCKVFGGNKTDPFAPPQPNMASPYGLSNGQSGGYVPQSPVYGLRSPAHYLAGGPGAGRGANPGVFSGARGRGGRRDDSLTNTMVRIQSGPWKGYRGRVKDATDTTVRIELDSQMKTITVNRDQLNLKEGRRDEAAGGYYPQTPSRAYPQTPSRAYPQTPSREYPQTPARDSSAMPMTPSRGRAWDPYTPMTPAREPGWNDEPPSYHSGPSTFGSATASYAPYSPIDSPAPSPSNGNPDTPGARPYDAPTPGSGTGWGSGATPYSDQRSPVDTPGSYQVPSPYTPGDRPTPYVPPTPTTPGGSGAGVPDPMSPAIGTPLDNSSWPIPNVWVMASERQGILREILPEGGFKVQIGSGTDPVEFVTAQLADLELIAPRKGDNIKIVSGEFRGLTGKLIGIDGSDGIVKLDGNMDIKILEMSNLGKVGA